VLRVPADLPVNNFWSVVVYDALSRSELRNDMALPSVSQYTGPVANDDGTVDIYFGPSMPARQEHNWIQTVPGRGLVPDLPRLRGARAVLRPDLEAPTSN
jgi:hypothetical protein